MADQAGRGPACAVHTLGCKVNQYESERLVAALAGYGFELVDFREPADVYILNSCAVTREATHKSRQFIRRAAKRNPAALVVVTGCYSEADAAAVRAVDGVDLVFGNADKAAIPDLIRERLGLGTGRAAARTCGNGRKPQSRTRALLKIQDGCDQFCSYCIVPYVRGAPVSRPHAELVREASELVEGGMREIVLTGIRLGLYGVDCGRGPGLSGLVTELMEIPGLERIRLSSIEVKEIAGDLVELMRSSPKLCRHLHIPLQSGDDGVLRSMNRNYAAREYLDLVDSLNARVPGLALTTDVIVGFPGEDEEAFRATVSAVRHAGFSKLHVFRYSPRPGTAAARMPDSVPANEKERRARALIDIGDELRREYAGGHVGRTLDVLVETVEGGWMSGLSDNYLKVHAPVRASVHAPREGEIVGELVTVEVNEERRGELFGTGCA